MKAALLTLPLLSACSKHEPSEFEKYAEDVGVEQCKQDLRNKLRNAIVLNDDELDLLLMSACDPEYKLCYPDEDGDDLPNRLGTVGYEKQFVEDRGWVCPPNMVHFGAHDCDDNNVFVHPQYNDYKVFSDNYLDYDGMDLDCDGNPGVYMSPAPDSLPKHKMYLMMDRFDIDPRDYSDQIDPRVCHWVPSSNFIRPPEPGYPTCDDDGAYYMEACVPEVDMDWNYLASHYFQDYITASYSNLALVIAGSEVGNSSHDFAYDNKDRFLGAAAAVYSGNDSMKEEVYQWVLPMLENVYGAMDTKSQDEFRRLVYETEIYLEDFDYNKERDYLIRLQNDESEYASEDDFIYIDSNGNWRASRPIQAWIYRRVNKAEMTAKEILTWLQRFKSDLF